ncbi:DUF461 domain-containing protein [Streptomyces sp. NPDC006971]|uniref:DUF461 domain-containing protein n=1 Tax=Streptomyces sp. NPDC006971 TaxID=3154784 RepID=UPI0033CE747F
MSRSLRHGALAATAIVFSIASLTACGAGNDAATLQIKPDSAATTSGEISIQNANLITQPERNAEGPAVVSATLFNNGTKQQTLDSVTLPGTNATVKLHAAEGSGPVVVPAGGRVIIGGKGNASAVIENGREAAPNGSVQNVVFKFSSTGEIPLGVFVVPATSYFTDFGPSSLPTAPSQKPTSPATTPTGSTTPGAPGEAHSENDTPAQDDAEADAPSGD